MTPNRDTELRALIEALREESRAEKAEGANKEWAEWVRERHMASASAKWDAAIRLEALLTRTEAGAATFANAGDSEAQFIADGENLNCPTCGGSGHVDDAAHVGDGDTVIAILDAAGYITPGKLEQARAIAANFTHPQDASGDSWIREHVNLIYSLIPNLPVGADTAEQATTALTQFCYSFGHYVNDPPKADAPIPKDSDHG